MAEPTASQGQGITRREFLNYVWGAAISLFLAEFGIGAYLFMLPRFREGEFGADFDLGVLSDILPQPDSGPAEFPGSKTWLLNIGSKEAAKGQGKEGLMAIYKVCTHLGCLYKFEPTTERFECPCHGSKFHLDGTKIQQEGPAPRGLDRFIVELKDENGGVIATTPEPGPGEDTYPPLPLKPEYANLRVVVRTGQRKNGGAPKPDPA